MNKLVQVNVESISEKIYKVFENGIQSPLGEEELMECVKICSDNGHIDPDWQILSGRLRIWMIKRIAPATFSTAMKVLGPRIHSGFLEFVTKNAKVLDDMVISENDYNYPIFAVETMIKTYLSRMSLKDMYTALDITSLQEYVSDELHCVETPQYMYLRVAVYLWYPQKTDPTQKDFENIKTVYKELSEKKYTHASPTLFNAGFARPQLASCFTLTIEDSLDAISESWTECALISKHGGGVGIDFSSLRHSAIAGAGSSRGVVPWIQILNSIMKAVDQGGKRNGVATCYLSDWHYDLFEFLELATPHGKEAEKKRDLTYALWISDEFMRRVDKDEYWMLVCPKQAKDCLKRDIDGQWGVEFEMTYRQLEKRVNDKERTAPSRVRKMRARDIWGAILETQTKSGMPFIMYRDACNRKSNQRNIGPVKSNLCTEILLHTDRNNIGSCNLASLSLSSCVVSNYTDNGVYFDYMLLEQLTRQLVRNLNQVIDRTYYPSDIPQIQAANFKNRPLGIGVQGLADVFALLDISWLSSAAKRLNIKIFETMYYAAVSESVALAQEFGAYESFNGSPASEGKFQFDLWNDEARYRDLVEKVDSPESIEDSQVRDNLLSTQSGARTQRYDWKKLSHAMKTYGLRNSLLIALMPTASTASILGNTECFEPITSNIYLRTVLSGQYLMINTHLVRDLQKIDLWSTDILQKIWKANGSIQDISLPTGLTSVQYERFKYLQEKYRTVYELPQNILLQMSLDRARFVCQTQSFSCWMKNVTADKLSKYHFYGWRRGAKTGMYYLRQPSKANPINVSLQDLTVPSKMGEKVKIDVTCNGDTCIMCSS